jgi:hypothetical protein
MRIRTIVLASTVISAIFLTACGGGSKKALQNKSTPLAVESKMSGALSENFEVVNAVLKTEATSYSETTKLLVEIKRTTTKFSFKVEDADVCGVSSGKKYTYCITADVLNETGIPVSTNLDKYGYDPFEKCLSLNAGETIWLEFSCRASHDEAKKVKLISSLVKNAISNTSDENKLSSSSDSEDWNAVLKSYEEYIDKYIVLLKKAKNGDASAMTEYVSMMEKATELSEKMQNAGSNLSTSQMTKFLKLQTKLTNAALEMQ